MVSQECADISETPAAVSIMRAASSCETLVHFYWNAWHYMPYYLQFAIHSEVIKKQGISWVNSTVRGTQTVASIETEQHIKYSVITDIISNSLPHQIPAESYNNNLSK